MKFNRNLTFWFLLLTPMVLAGCGGGSQPSVETGPDTSGGIGWPPPNPVREASEHSSVMQGAEYVAAGGNVSNLGSDLVMIGGTANTPWAIYATGDLNTENELISINATVEVVPDDPGDGTKLYYAVANHHRKVWEWIDTPSAENPWLCPEIEAHRYRNDLGYAHLAVALGGPGTARIDTVTFTHDTQTIYVDAPENLVAEGTAVEEVTLDWDDVPGAAGYNVFRSTDADFISQAQINTEPVTDSTYVDTLSTNGRYYFYRVTALATNESDPSNIARAWVFGDDLPVPFNLRVSARGDDNFTAAWDWDDPVGGNPYGFRLYIDTVPFFTLDSQTAVMHTIFGAARENTFHGLEEGTTYYWKLCAYDGMTSPSGRMSVEETGSVTGSWTWGAFEVIGTGQPPVRAVVGDSAIAVSYFNGFEVDFAIQDGANWRIETPLPDSTWYFKEYQDLCYGGGTYLVTSFAHDPGDCWVAEWDTNDGPGSWNAYMAQGEGTTGLGVPVSGLNVACTASDTEFAVLLYHLTNTDLVQITKTITDDPVKNSWSATVIRDTYTAGCTPSHSGAYHDGNLYVLSGDNFSDELYFGDRTGGYAWSDIRDGTTPKLSKHHDLNWLDGEWWSPGYQTVDRDLYLIHGTATPWTADREDGAGGVNVGLNARMDVEGEDAVVIQYKDNKYFFGMYSNGWDWNPINVPAVADYGTDADVVLRNGRPYIVFQDEDTGEIKIAMGTPPV